MNNKIEKRKKNEKKVRVKKKGISKSNQNEIEIIFEFEYKIFNKNLKFIFRIEKNENFQKKFFLPRKMRRNIQNVNIKFFLTVFVVI